MALVLDTDTLPPGERAEAVEAAMRFARVPASLTHDPAPVDVRARLDLWELGPGVSLLHRTGTGVRLRRSDVQARRDAEPRASLTLLGPGRWRFRQHEVDQVMDTPTWGACLVDQSSPYEYQRVGISSMVAVGVDLAALGLSAEVVRAAAGRLRASPLFRLVSEHVLHLARTADQVRDPRAAAMVGSATVDLVRALVTTSSTPEALAGLSEAALLHQTREYVDRHLTDPDLRPELIARAHHVSLRLLYAAWADSAESLATYLIRRRLELARRTLAEPRTRTRTIAAVAHQCGFVDAAHFSRRFREAYGMSPREWRRITSLGPFPGN